MKRAFVFCHGFGFEPNFWQHLKPFFNQAAMFDIDLGYFDQDQQPELSATDTEWIGIGHSLGFIKLLESNIPFKALIGLNAFVNFIGQDEQLKKRRTIELKALRKQFKSSPKQALAAFYQRCGLSNHKPPTKPMHIERILQSLEHLSQQHRPVNHITTLIIGSQDDVVVPESLIHDNFLNTTNTEIIMLSKGGHALGLVSAELVYQHISIFLDNYAQTTN